MVRFRLMNPALVLVAATILSLFAAGPISGQDGKANPRAEARRLTIQLLELRGQFLRAGPAKQAAVRQLMLGAAAQRYDLLEELIEQNPAEALRIALPPQVRAGLPAAVRALLEEEATLEGILEVNYECGEQESRLHFGLQTAKEKLSLHFAQQPAGYLETGAHVRVRGMRLGTNLALDSASNNSSFQALASALPNTFGEQKTAVILVNFQNAPSEPYTKDYAGNVVFNTTSAFDMENSHSQTWLTGEVFGWFTIPVSSTVCDTTSIEQYAKQAAIAAGADLTPYRRFVFGFPKNACSWWGLGSVGGNPSRAFINGSFTLKVVGHEMGHNFGLYHSRTATNEYGDTLDIMGNPSADHFNAFQKERLGWLNYQTQPPIVTVQNSGEFFLDPYSAPSTNPKALKILKETDPATGRRTWYYVEHRRAIGFDSGVSGNSNVLNGVVVHTGSESTGNSSYLLDMTPSTSTFTDPALEVGNSFIDDAAGVTLTPVSTSGSGAAVRVSLGSSSCVAAAPGLSADSAQSQYAAAGSTLTYSVTLKNNDSAGCTATSFTTGVNSPSGWISAVNPVSVTLDPGASASITVQVTSPSPAQEGLYDIPVISAGSADPGKAASVLLGYGVAAAPVCVPANPVLTVVSSASQSAAAGASLTYRLSLTNSDSAACQGAIFNLSASLPAGWSAVFNPIAVTLTPGASVPITVTTTSAAQAAEGSYLLQLKAAGSPDSRIASVSVTHIVAQRLGVSLSADKSSYTAGEKVSITAKITSGGSAVSGATVSFTVSKPNGGSVTKILSTKPNGSAVYTFQLARKEAPGLFGVKAVATATGNSGEGTTSFTVNAATSSGK